MTIAEAERFYKQDLKKYDIAKNRELLSWLKESIKNGYHSFIDIQELQEMIDNIVYWYEMKYPERELEYYEGTRYFNFEEMEPLSKKMDLKQLMYRLPHNQLCLMECDYRSNGGGIRDVYDEDGNVIGHKTILFMRIDRKNALEDPFSMCGKVSDFLLRADTDTGIVDVDCFLDDYVDIQGITLDEVLTIFKEKYSEELDFKKLELCILDHNCDIELRNRILQLVALKLLYSRNTIPERGYERAKRFIGEFNKKMNLDLSTEEIDEAINRDYTNGERWEHVLKTYTDSNGDEQSYWTVEDVSKKDKTLAQRARGLVKSFLKR